MIVNTRGARVASRRVGRRLLVCVSAVVLLAACNGDDDPVSSSAPPVTPVTIAPTTVATTSDPPTTTVAQTDPPTTTASSTIAVTATSASPPTTASASPPTSTGMSREDQALAAVEGHYATWRECLRSISNCDTSVFDEYMTGPRLASAMDTVAAWKANSYEVANVDSLNYEVLDVDLDFTVPFLLVCETDGSSLIERHPGQPDRLVEEGYVEAIREIQLEEFDGRWKVRGFHTREEVWNEAGALCS